MFYCLIPISSVRRSLGGFPLGVKNVGFQETSLKKWMSISAFIAFLVVVLFLFQNCSQSVVPGNNSGSSTSPYWGAPFAYQYKPDFIAYMSCSGSVTNERPQAQFSFKVGALGFNRGLGLRSEFLDNYRQLSAQEKIKALLESEKKFRCSGTIGSSPERTSAKLLRSQYGE